MSVSDAPPVMVPGGFSEAETSRLRKSPSHLDAEVTVQKRSDGSFVVSTYRLIRGDAAEAANSGPLSKAEAQQRGLDELAKLWGGE
jgi:hypothetical protein